MTRTNFKRIDFLSAVRRGMSSVVREHLQGHFEGELFLDEDENKIHPFQVALDHKRWKVALDILEFRNQNEHLLPPGITFDEEEIERSKIDNGPVEAGTPVKQAINELLRALALERNDRPLPKSLQDRMLPFLDLLIQSDGLDNTLLRVLSQQPKWLDWSIRLLDAGADPNAIAVHQFTGATVHTLEVAGRGGLEREVDELLKRGADPYYKHHTFDLAAHRVARATAWPPPRRGWDRIPLEKSIDLAADRKRCLDRILEIEGMARIPAIDGKDPLSLWKEGLDTLGEHFFKRIDEFAKEDGPRLVEKVMRLKIDQAPIPGTSPSPAPKKMRL